MDFFDALTLFGGLGLFLYGMQMMGDGLSTAAGDKLKGLLEKLTTNPFMGILVGTLVTCVIQSSSATTVMAVGFVNAGLMTLPQAFNVMLGANIGTTITAQIIAFKMTDWAPLFIIIGVICILFIKRRMARNIGTIIAGFGILFLGMNIMSDSLVMLKEAPWFVNMMSSFDNPIMALLIGVVATAILQSSSATVGILQTLAATGLVNLSTGLFMVLGCNIGTCATALLASIGTGTNARRTAIMHLINKSIGALVFTVLLYILPIANWIASLSPGDPVWQIANFHTFFNILNTLLLVPFGKAIIAFCEKVVPNGPEDDEDDGMRLKFLDDRILETPPFAIAQLQKEIERFCRKSIKNYNRAMEAFFLQNEQKSTKVFEEERALNFIGQEITEYMVKIQGIGPLSEQDKQYVFKMHDVITNIERIGDHAENIAEFAEERMEHKVEFSTDALEELQQMGDKVNMVLTAGSNALKGVEMPDSVIKAEIYEEDVDLYNKQLRRRHIERLNNKQCSPIAGMIFNGMTIDLERIADHAVNIAQSFRDHTK